MVRTVITIAALSLLSFGLAGCKRTAPAPGGGAAANPGSRQPPAPGGGQGQPAANPSAAPAPAPGGAAGSDG